MSQGKRINLSLIIKVFKFTKSYKLYIFLTFLTMVLYSICYQGRVILIKPLFDEVFIAGNIDYLIKLAVISLFLAFLIGTFDFLQNYLKEYVILRVLVDFRRKVFNSIMKFPVGFFTKTKSGDIVSRVTNDINTTRDALDFLLSDVLLQPLMILAGFASALYLTWQLTLITFIGLPLIYIPITRMFKKIKESKKKSLVKLADVTDTIIEAIDGLKVIRVYGLENKEDKNFLLRNLEYLRKALKVVRTKAMSSGLTELIYAIGFSIIFLIGGVLLVKKTGGITAGAFSGFLLALVAINKPVKSLTKAFNSLVESIAGCERVFELIEMAERQKSAFNDLKPVKDISKGIEFKNVSFSYDTVVVLKDISVSMQPGEVICLVGPSGAGKTTFLSLAMCFYMPTEGEVLIDGIKSQEVLPESLYAITGFLSAEPYLFNTTILENILCVNPKATLDDVIKACKKAYIYDFIQTLPDKFNTIVGPRGAKLSSGQKQRIALARIFLKNPKIVVMDEPFSNLDAESEKYVEEAIFSLMEGRLTIIATHRLNCVCRATKILVFKDGRIVERGTHKELISKEEFSEYKKLYQEHFREATAKAY